MRRVIDGASVLGDQAVVVTPERRQRRVRLVQLRPGLIQLGMLVGEPGAELLFQGLETGQRALRLLEELPKHRACIVDFGHAIAITLNETSTGTTGGTPSRGSASAGFMGC